MNILVLDNIIKNPDIYVKEVLDKEFIDIEDGTHGVFKGIQPRKNDELEGFVLKLFPNYSVGYNFVRQSPCRQVEPNFIHSDEMMGDKTVLLYLNKEYPSNAGTTIYNEDVSPSCVIYMKYNRLVVFDSYHKHSRNLKDNFGKGEDSRLVQVMFLNSQ